MKRKMKFCVGGGLLVLFALWTALVRLVDVQAIGPQGSKVGFGAMNGGIHQLTGVHPVLYTVTDWLSLVPLGCMLGFAFLGAVQWGRRRDIRKVDRSILLLGAFYAAVLAVFVFFEVFVVNYRPVLIEGRLEASYPSSTTMLVLCVMPTAMMQLRVWMNCQRLRRWTLAAMGVFTVFMVVGRLFSGVHWFSDIIGGVLLSGGLVMLYGAVCGLE